MEDYSTCKPFIDMVKAGNTEFNIPPCGTTCCGACHARRLPRLLNNEQDEPDMLLSA